MIFLYPQKFDKWTDTKMYNLCENLFQRRNDVRLLTMNFVITLSKKSADPAALTVTESFILNDRIDARKTDVQLLIRH